MICPNVNLILGPPGCGKTQSLLNIVDEYFSAGGVPEKVGFISFTKKAVDEARDRAIQRFGFSRSTFKYFRTIHSLAFLQLGMSRAEVLQKSHYKELGEIIGMPVTGIHRQDQMVYEMAKGDQMCFIESLSRLTCRTLEETWNALNNDVAFAELDYFQRALKEYKSSKLLYDFTDMLVRFQTEAEIPKLDLLVVDEAQDLCKLQWEIVNRLRDNADRTFIAGDDDQAIFRWSGADIEYFLSLSKIYRTRILDQSYRLPKEVFTLAEEIVKRIDDRNPKTFRPTPDQGAVTVVRELQDIDMDAGEWLLLVRNSYAMQDIMAWLRMMGYPYQTAFYSTQTDEGVRAAAAWEHLRAGQTVDADHADLALSFMKGDRGKSSVDVTMETLLSEKRVNLAESKRIWHEALTQIEDRDRDYYIAARRRGEALNKPPRIKLSTIHGAKGGECENVVVFTDISYRTYKGLQSQPDDEHRVFYVGVTRAKKNLFIVQPRAVYYYTV